MTPFVIVLPVRNGAAHIRQAVASILAQGDGDLRLVVLENASEDDTAAIVRSFDDPRVELRPADEPLPIECNWARVRDVAAEVPGDTLLSVIGHDDCLYPDFVTRMRALAQAHPDATLFQSHFDLIDAQGALIRPCRPIAERETWQDLAAMIAWGVRDAFGTGYAFRARDYLAVGGIPALPGILYADHLLFLRLTRLGHKRADPMKGCAYRLHATSMSNAVSVGRINERLAAFTGFLEALDTELAEWVCDDRGRDALLTLLAREVFVFGNPVVRGSLNIDNRRRLRMLEHRIVELGGSHDLSHWAYQASRSQRIIDQARRAFAYARARLRG